MFHFRHRRRLKRKEIERLTNELEPALGCKVFSVGDTVDMAEGADFDIVLVNGNILALAYDQKPFLTVRGLLEYKPTKRYVTVDMGAVKFVCNGADIMCPGIVDADTDIKEEDFVWIRDEKNLKPLAIGISLLSGKQLIEANEGKGVKNLHYVGDKLWKFED
jgi:PUA-domain protein